jgi:hypothetical protein
MARAGSDSYLNKLPTNMYNVTHTHHPLAAPKVIATIDELSAGALEAALATLAGHRAKILSFEIDEDDGNFANAFSDRGEVYAIEKEVNLSLTGL